MCLQATPRLRSLRQRSASQRPSMKGLFQLSSPQPRSRRRWHYQVRSADLTVHLSSVRLNSQRLLPELLKAPLQPHDSNSSSLYNRLLLQTNWQPQQASRWIVLPQTSCQHAGNTDAAIVMEGTQPGGAEAQPVATADKPPQPAAALDLGAGSSLPPAVAARLAQIHADNTVRMRAPAQMLGEAAGAAALLPVSVRTLAAQTSAFQGVLAPLAASTMVAGLAKPQFVRWWSYSRAAPVASSWDTFRGNDQKSTVDSKCAPKTRPQVQLQGVAFDTRSCMTRLACCHAS